MTFGSLTNVYVPREELISLGLRQGMGRRTIGEKCLSLEARLEEADPW